MSIMFSTLKVKASEMQDLRPGYSFFHVNSHSQRPILRISPFAHMLPILFQDVASLICCNISYTYYCCSQFSPKITNGAYEVKLKMSCAQVSSISALEEVANLKKLLEKETILKNAAEEELTNHKRQLYQSKLMEVSL